MQKLPLMTSLRGSLWCWCRNKTKAMLLMPWKWWHYHSILKRFLSIFCIICAFLIPQIDLLQVEQLQILAKIESR